MPAMNASGTVAANPSLGLAVMMSSFAGPKGSPFDAKTAPYYDNLPGGVAWSAPVADPNNLSTGALSTGIGFGLNDFDGFEDGQPGWRQPNPNLPAEELAQEMIRLERNFSDDYTPGLTIPALADATDSRLVAIGGGKSAAAVVGVSVPGVSVKDGIALPVPYTAGFPLLAFGGGGSRDAGAGPAFTGFGLKSVTTTATVAVGAAVEAGFLNRTSFAIEGAAAVPMTVFGSATAASAAPA